MGDKVKKVGGWLRFAWNFFLAGKTVKVKGRDVKLPKFQSDGSLPADELGLRDEP